MGMGLAALGLVALSGGAAAGDGRGEALAELERMIQSLRSLDYSGTFVYLHDNQLEALEIVHSVADGEERERLMSLNGAAREVRRDPAAVTCVMPESRAISVDQRIRRAGLWQAAGVDLGRIESHYILHPLGDSRVAGRDTRVVGIVPKDKLRYGYRFYLDRDTGLPLKTDLMDENARPVEQIMFTSLSLHAPRPAEAEADERNLQGFRKVERSASQSSGPDEAPTLEFDALPSGFGLHMHNRWLDAEGTQVEHYVLSDGLASVSVYVETGDDDGLAGGAHMGAVNAWGDRVGERQVTAVGEVPQTTVRQVIENLRHTLAGVER